MSGRLVHRGPDSDGLFHRRAGRRSRRGGSRSSTSSTATSRSPTRTAASSSSRTARSTTTASCGGSSRARGHRFATDSRHRGPRPPLRGARRRVRRAAAGDVRDRPLGRARAGGCCWPATASGSSRSTTGSPAATLSFASELKAMLEQPGFSREIDPRAVAAYLAFNSIPAPLTIFAEARKLPAGHLLVWEGGEVAMRRYARPRPGRRPTRSAARPGGELAAELREVAARLGPRPPRRRRPGRRAALRRRRLRRPHRARRGRVAASRVRTFSIGFEESGFDELARARLVAERYGTDHHELVLRPDAVELLPKLVEAFDEPFGDSSALPDLPRLRAGRRRGQGRALRRGRRRALRRLLHLRRRPARPPRRPPRGARRAAGRGAAELRQRRVGFDYKAKRFARAAAPAAAGAPPRLEGDLLARSARAALLGDRDRRLGPARPLPRALRRNRGRRAAGADAGRRPRHLPGRRPAGQDRPARAWPTRWSCGSPSSTSASPSFALALPTALKVRGFAKKRLLRRALAPLLPREIVRGRKQGFSIPLAAWLRGPLEPFAREVLSPATLDAPGLPRPRRGHAAARPPLRRARGPQPPALGPDGASPSGSTAMPD